MNWFKNILKSFMKRCSGPYPKGTKTLPSEGGGKRVGVKDLTGVARRLRKHSTDTEQHLWRHLRDRQIEGFKFRRQQPVGPYVVDFLNLEKKSSWRLMAGSTHSVQAIRYVMNGSGLKDIRCSGFGITTYSTT